MTDPIDPIEPAPGPSGARRTCSDPLPDPTATLDPEIASWLKRDPEGLVAAVIQEESTSEVLMVGWMDDEALRRTLTTGRSTFYSRSRGEYWVKGETSGHRQWVREVRLDCDGDTLLVKVRQDGPACHTGTRTCFDAKVLPAVVTDPAVDTDPAVVTDPAGEGTR
ncbi:MAG: hisI [Propionibacteriaceae bacterium]|nr:hisI [Propionibacteriaceae bacterium]